MAEALAIEGAKWVASPIITGLIKEGFSYLGVGISTKLQELETTILPQFQLVIEAAERSSVHKDKVQLWLRELKDAAYEAEDVLDEYKYQLLEEKVSDLDTRPELKPLKKFAGKVNTKLSILSPQKIKLKRILNKLEGIAAKAKTFREQLGIPIGNDGTVGGQPAVTTSFPLHKVLGREKERDEIVDKYLLDQSEASEPEKRYSVITIVGIGGAGKTTLAQLIYNDPRVAAHFDVKMWVCVSRTLDVFRHTREMIESSSSEKCSLLDNLDTMQNKLAELVKSKKILLVLDDVWFDRSTGSTEEEWLTLVAPLAKSVKSGSKVLVTTRTTILPVALRPQYSMALKDLEENHILSLFKLHAFGSTELDGSHLQQELMTIGKQIVQRLHGSPLAARAVGSRLGNTLNVGAWKSALERDNLGNSQQALSWSYQRLDAPLQRCFSYFSLFPKGHKYEAEEMVHLWIAEGFINSSNNRKRMEDIGMEYFDELVYGSFLQHREDDTRYYMHDLFHDLAEKVSKEDCLRIEDGDQVKEFPPTIRRLSIFCEPARKIRRLSIMSFNRLENLHTLIVEAGPRSSRVIDNLFPATDKCNTKLRVLRTDGVRRGTLTKLMAKLKHLRFLSFYLRKADQFVLPATLGKLYHLQFLDARHSRKVGLPRSAKNLINLRHHVTRDDKALESLPDIGRLTSLQTLPRFVVKKEKGHDIGQLNNLNELRGSLRISNLKNVEGKDMAVEANLKDKRYLESLHLEWGKGSNDDESDEYKRDLDIEVIEGLQPHPNLTKLSIEGYRSPRYPSWLLREGCLQNLRYLTLEHCTALEVLPPIGNLFELYMLALPKISKFPSLSQRLKKLEIRICSSLIIVSEEEVQKSDEDRKKSIMTAMQSYQLIIRELKAKEVARDCLEVQRLLESEKVDVPEDFTTLATTLQSCERVDDIDLQKAYYRCQELRLEAIFGRREKSELILPSSLQSLKLDRCNITDGALSQSLQGLTSLKSLKLYNINTITTLPAEEVLHHLIALTELKINGCHQLKSLRGLYALPSLEELCVEKCPSLASLSLSHQTALTRLTIRDCHWLSSLLLLNCLESLEQVHLENCLSILLPEHLPESLSILELWYCPRIYSLPELLPKSLNSLYLRKCPSISSLPEHLPQSLIFLSLRNCPSISSLPEHLPQSLDSLHLSNCPSISSLPEHLPQSLNSLRLHNCPSISSLPKHLPQSLTKLNLDNCPSISSLPEHLPQSLTFISIWRCQILKERCRSPNGEDWPKIAHIPDRRI